MLGSHCCMAQKEVGLFEGQYNSALKNFEDGDISMALFQLNEIVRLNPEYLDAYYLRGRIFSNIQEYDKSLTDFNHLIKKIPNIFPEIFVERGLVYSSIQKFELAINDYTNALKIENNNLFAYIQRGYCFFEMAEFEKAIQDLDKALNIDPFNKHALYIRGSIHVYDLENDQLAINDFTRLLEIDSTNFEVYLDRGNAYLNLNMHDKACKDYNTALKNGVNGAKDSIIEFCE